MKLLETEWITYRNMAIPRNAGLTQLTESRRAFFAGASALYSLLMNRLEPGSDAGDADLMFMEKLRVEMAEFAERVEKGQA